MSTTLSQNGGVACLRCAGFSAFPALLSIPPVVQSVEAFWTLAVRARRMAVTCTCGACGPAPSEYFSHPQLIEHGGQKVCGKADLS